MKKDFFLRDFRPIKNPKGTEILSRFSINCNPVLILNAIETGIPDLVRLSSITLKMISQFLRTNKQRDHWARLIWQPRRKKC